MQNDKFRLALADSLVPLHLHNGLISWVEFGILPGSFLRAVISNDLSLAVLRADDFCREKLYEIVSFLATLEGSAASAFFTPNALNNWPLYIQAENRAEAEEQNRIAAEITEEMERDNG